MALPVPPYETEKTVQKQFMVFGAQVLQRTVTYTTKRGIYANITAAESALSTWMQEGGTAIRDGSCRRIQPNGWAEVIFVTKSYGSWSPLQ